MISVCIRSNHPAGACDCTIAEYVINRAHLDTIVAEARAILDRAMATKPG